MRSRDAPACEAKCNAGASPSSCGSFSGCLLSGSVEVGVDVVEGRRVAELACDKGDVLGCRNLGEADLLDGAAARAQVAWTKAFRLASAECDHGVADGCYMAGNLASEGKGTRRDEARAAALADRACALGHRVSCLLRDSDAR